MKKFLKRGLTTLGVAALIAFGFEMWLSYNHVPIADSNVLLVGGMSILLVAVVVGVVLIFGVLFLVIFMRVMDDRRDERRNAAQSQSEMAQLANQALISAQVASYLAAQVASGLRLVEVNGREMLALPGQPKLVDVESETDLTSEELNFIEEEQRSYLEKR